MSLKIPIPRDGNASGIRRALAMLVERLSEFSDQVFSSLTLTGLTASRLLSVDSTKKLQSVSSLSSWVTGSDNITTSDDTGGTVVVDTIQDIMTTSSPTFTSLTLTGLTASSFVMTDGNKALVTTNTLDMGSSI
jgi:hypothetical protein